MRSCILDIRDSSKFYSASESGVGTQLIQKHHRVLFASHRRKADIVEGQGEEQVPPLLRMLDLKQVWIGRWRYCSDNVKVILH